MASRSEINRISDSLLRGFAESPTSEYQRESKSFILGDVEFDVERLSASVHFWTRYISAKYPCAFDKDGAIPIMITFMGMLFPGDWERLRGPFSYESFFPGSENFYAKKGIRLDQTSPHDLKDVFRERLIRFLSARGGEDEAPTPMTARAVGAAPAGFSTRINPYIDFEVHTQESNLRIHYSPAYFLDWSHVFGSPTTPSVGWILPGRYKFGAMRMNGDFLIDNANFDVPPTTAAHLVLR